LGWVAAAAGFFFTVVFGGEGDVDLAVLGAAAGVAFTRSS